MLRCYYDASGKGESDISCVAGYVAYVDEWARVEALWQEALKDYGLDKFHQRTVKDFLSINSWMDLEKRLNSIIKDADMTAVGAAIVDAHWRKPDWGYLQTERLGSIYEQCLDMAFEVLSSLMKQKHFGKAFEIVCCRDADERKIARVYRHAKDRYGFEASLRVGSASDHVPLQCADFGAWRLRKSWIGIGFERSDVPWGAMPVGKGGYCTSIWSLKPHATLARTMALRCQQPSDV